MLAELVATAALAVLPGFTEAPRLEPAASFVAGKHVAVYCGDTSTLSDDEPMGMADVAGSRIFLHDSFVCVPLLYLRVKAADIGPEDFGRALHTLVHESLHVRGVTDESATDCAALRQDASAGILFFGLRGRRLFLRDMMRAAWQAHRETPPQYRTLC